MRNNFPSREIIEELRKKYPKGTRVKLIQMKDEPFPIEVGTLGVIEHIDDMGTIFVNWENGRGLGLAYGKDEFQVI